MTMMKTTRMTRTMTRETTLRKKAEKEEGDGEGRSLARVQGEMEDWTMAERMKMI